MRKDNVKKRNFYKAIFNMIKDGKTPSDISKILKTDRQKIYYYTNNLKKWKLIEKIGKGRGARWRVIVKEFSLGTRPSTFTKPKTNLHALQIKIPILSGKINDKGWKKGEKLKNWTPKYKTFKDLGGITLKNNNNRSVTLFLRERDIKDLKEVKELVYNSLNWANSYFKPKNVTLDIFSAEVKNLDLATEDKDASSMRNKGERFKLDLDRKSEQILPKDNINANAWIDGSPFNFSAETNDLLWKKDYLSMPTRMKHSTQLLHYIAQNYASHVGVVEKLNNLLDKPKVKKKIVKEIEDNAQTKLKEFMK